MFNITVYLKINSNELCCLFCITASTTSSSHLLAQWRMNSIQQESDSSDDEDEFFDAPGLFSLILQYRLRRSPLDIEKNR